METIYCEFCGAVATTKARDARRLVRWTHKVAKDVVRCDKHRKTSKRTAISRSHDAYTGEEV